MLFIKPVEIGVERAFYPPLELLYLAAALENAGEEVEILDCRVNENYKERLSGLLKRHTVVGINVAIGNISSAISIAKAIRKFHSGIRIIMGGPQATAIYSYLIPQFADIVVIGEGEETIIELVKEKDLSKIKGIAYWDKEVKINPRREWIKSLDKIAPPAYHITDFKEYGKFRWKFFKHQPMYMLTSRGCPFQCKNCTKFVHGSRIRLRSIDNVMQELDYLIKELGLKEIHFWDDAFTFYPERVKELCQRIIDARYPKDVCFALPGGVRADIDDLEMFKMMKMANFYYITIAIESGVQEIINKLGKKLDLKKARKTIELVNKVGFERVQAFFIIGLPFDTVETINQSINFAVSLPIDSALFFICLPFPGTELYDMVKKEGRFLQDVVTAGSYFDGKATFEMDHLSAKDIERLFRKAYRKFFLSPKRVCRVLSKKIISREIFSTERIAHYWDAFRLFLVEGNATKER